MASVDGPGQGKAFVRKTAEVAPVPCPCGEARRIITARDKGPASIHRVVIRGEAKLHYHKVQTEYYVVLSGEGDIELDGERHAVEPGDVICIPPGTRHALRGHFEIINVVIPPFDASDEYLAE